jgi:hypothetical protein
MKHKRKRPPRGFSSKINVGDRVGSWSILESIVKNNRRHYRCKCDCGRIREVIQHNLLNGRSTSCGSPTYSRTPLSQGETSLNEKFAVCRNTARVRGFDFNLSIEEYKEIVKKECFYCAEPPKKYNRYFKQDGTLAFNSYKILQSSIDRAWTEINTVDRMDSNKGYTKENCVAACWSCNEMKMDTPIEDFFAKISKIYSHRLKKEIIE